MHEQELGLKSCCGMSETMLLGGDNERQPASTGNGKDIAMPVKSCIFMLLFSSSRRVRWPSQSCKHNKDASTPSGQASEGTVQMDIHDCQVRALSSLPHANAVQPRQLDFTFSPPAGPSRLKSSMTDLLNRIPAHCSSEARPGQARSRKGRAVLLTFSRSFHLSF